MVNNIMRGTFRILILAVFLAVVATILSGGFAVAILTTLQLFKGLSVQPGADTSITIIAMMLFPMLALAPLIEWWFKLWSSIDQTVSGGNRNVAHIGEPSVLLRDGVRNRDCGHCQPWLVIGLVGLAVLVVMRRKFAPISRGNVERNN